MAENQVHLEETTTNLEANLEELQNTEEELNTANEELQEELQESEKRYRELVKYAPAGIYEVDFRTRKFISANDVVCILTGYSRAELLEMSPFDILDPPSQALFQERLQRWLAGEEPDQSVEYRVIAKDGHEIFALLNVSFTRDAEGKPLGATVIGYDITERKQAEEALRLSEERFRIALENMPITVATLDRDLRYTWIYNPKGGFTPEEIIGKKIGLSVESDTVQEIIQNLENALNHDTTTMWESTSKAKTGEKTYFETHAEPLKNAEGEITGVAMVAVDITERKRMEEVVRQNEARYRSLVELSPDPILVHRGQRIELANRAALQLFGAQEADQILGKSPLDLFHPAYHDQIRQRIQTLLEGGSVPVMEEKIVRLDGDLRMVEVAASSIMDAEGPSIQLVLQDVTERDERESELKRLNRTLKALSDINQAMMRSSDEADYMDAVCKIVVEDCGHAMTWIGFAERDEAKTVRPVAYAGFEAGYIEKLKVTWADSERGRGPTGTAIRTGQVSMCRNMLTDPQFEPWRKDALERGYASSIVVPLRENDNVFGAITIYSREPNPFSPSEVELLSEMAGDLAYGILSIRTRQAHARAEAALLRSQERFRVAQELSLDAFTILEAVRDEYGTIVDFRWTYANPEAGRILLHEPNELVGSRLLELLPGNKANSDLFERYVRVVETGQPHDYELPYESEGIHGWFRNMTVKLGDGVAVYFTDITDRKKAEQALQQARDELEQRVHERTRELSLANQQLQLERQRFYDVLEMLPAYVVLLTSDYRISHANREFRQRFGESHGKRCYEFLFQRSEPCEICETFKTLKEMRPQEWEWTGPDSRNYAIYDFPFPDVDGSMLILEMGVDVTERKQAEQALRLVNAYNRSLLEANLDPLMTITAGGKIGDVNTATESLTGCSRQELIGTDFSDYFTQPEKARAGYRQVFDTGSVRDYELEVRHKDGHVTPVLYNASLYRDEAGGVAGVFAAARDLTERRQFESQLIQAEKHAVIGRMVGSVTHEINNPLQTIRNCLYLIQQDTKEDSPIQEPLEMAVSETTRITDLVGQLRELYRPHADQERKPTDLLEILEEVKTLLTSHLDNSKVRWKLLTGRQSCTINCVRDQMLEVFLNISMNAIEAMQRTGGVLSVGMNLSGSQVGVVFKDTGPGISPKILPHLFEPFMTTKSSGLGLGLSISYGIVQRHGGRIEVENSDQGGAVFTVWLPMAEPKRKEKVKHAN